MPSYAGETLAYATRETYDERRATSTLPTASALDGRSPISSRQTPVRSRAARRARAARPGNRNSWDLVAYILSLRTRHDDGRSRPRAAALNRGQP